MPDLKETLERIAFIGEDIASLSGISKELRMSLIPCLDSLPKSHQQKDVSLVVIGDRLYKIQPVTKETKIIDVTVTFDSVFLV